MTLLVKAGKAVSKYQSWIRCAWCLLFNYVAGDNVAVFDSSVRSTLFGNPRWIWSRFRPQTHLLHLSLLLKLS